MLASILAYGFQRPTRERERIETAAGIGDTLHRRSLDYGDRPRYRSQIANLQPRVN